MGVLLASNACSVTIHTWPACNIIGKKKTYLDQKEYDEQHASMIKSNKWHVMKALAGS